MSSTRLHIGRHVACRTLFGSTVLIAALIVCGCTRPDRDDAGASSENDTTETSSTASTNENGSSADASSVSTDEPDTTPSPQPTDAERQQMLDDAVARAWNARVAEDWATLYEFQQFRTAEENEVSVEDFTRWSKQNEPFVVRSFEIENISMEGDLGWALVDYESVIRQFPNAPAKRTQRDEKWQFVNDQWKLIPVTDYEMYPASPVVRDREAEIALRERYEQSWQALVNEDWEALYAMSDPRDRDEIAQHELAEAKSLTLFIERDIEWVQVIGDEGVVRVAITHKLNDPNLTKLPNRVVTISEQWVRIDGEWFIDLRPEGAG